MEESSGSSGKPLISRKSKYHTDIVSSYSLRHTPARSQPKPKSNSEKIRMLELPDFPKLEKPKESNNVSQSNSLPRRYPSRVRVSAVRKSPSCSPKTPVKSRGNEERESENRMRVKRALGEFRAIHCKLMARGGQRPDVEAYTLFKERHKDWDGISRVVGDVRGVEIGDEFDFRAEMILIGLHCHFVSNIDYVIKDERAVATSIVSVCSGRFSNYVRSSDDVLVSFGMGYVIKDQKMDAGNLAMKNSIADESPVRVIFGFKDERSTKKIRYVFGGLYSVEKYWSKKNEFGFKVFVFQLRRLEGQRKFDIKEFMKLVSSEADGKDAEDKHFTPSKCTSLAVRPSSDHDSAKVTNCFAKRGREENDKSEANEVESRKRVKQTLNGFLALYEKLAKEGEARQLPNKKKEAGEKSRFDIDAYNIYKDKNKDVSKFTRYAGAVPGVEVGDKFHFRAELSLIGLHCQLQGDVASVKEDEKLLAVSIVSRRFEQNKKNVSKLDVLVYCGSGSKNKDQQMIGGNLALKNSFDAKTPVRVCHGNKANKSVFYIYYGLYFVEKYWRKKDSNGFYAFMFRLKRLPGQPMVDYKEIRKSWSLRLYSAPRHTDDYSRGKEKVPIAVINTIDDEVLQPIKYITDVIYPSNYSPLPLEGCNCVNGCSDSDTCACAVRNGGELPFNTKGDIIEAKPLLYACGPNCKCPPSCHNRIKRDIKFPLEIFKTETMGWGVRSRSFIPSGSFICEYVGELLEDEEAQKRSTDEYLFAIGNNYYDESLWEGLSSVPCLKRSESSEADEDGGYTLDSSRLGNVGKFINHNCTPNLYAQNVLYDHDDKRMPHVIFFACEDIPPLQELSYHYNYIIDDVHDSEGNIRKKECYCGSIECTGRLY